MMLWIDIHEQIDARALWNDIEHYKVNETDLENNTLVYGDVDCETAMKVVACCMKYSLNLSFELKHSS